MVQKKSLPRRGRPRAYDPDDALVSALNTFWRSGYSGTSLDQLSEAMDMNRPSLYGAFGDKRTLYLTAMDRYISRGRGQMAEALSGQRPLEEELRSLYGIAISSYLPADSPARGCFLIGTAATEAVTDEEIRSRLYNALRGLDSAFEARLLHARTTGEIDSTADPTALAVMASAVLHTLAVRSRAGASRADLIEIVNASLPLICGAGGSAPAKKRATVRKRGTRTRPP